MKNSFYHPALLAVGLAAVSAPFVHAQAAQKISLSDAIRMARENSPLSTGGYARIAGANGRLFGAGRLANPGLTIAAPYGRDTSQLDAPLIIAQNFELGDKLRQRVHAARGERDAAVSDFAGTTNDLIYNAQSAYYDALRADSERQLAADALAVTQTFAAAAQTQFEAGDAPRSNVVRSQIELARAQQTLIAAQTDAENRYAVLRSLTGMPQTATLALSDTLTYLPANYSLPALQTLALRNRPDVRSARYLRSARDADLHGARIADTPDLFIEARHNSYHFDSGNNSLRIGFNIPLFDFGRTRAVEKSAQAALQEQSATLAETERVAKLDVETSYRNLEQARRAVESFQGGRLDRAKELLTMAQLGYSKGANSYLELLDAQQVYRSEQVEYTRSLAAYDTAKAALQRSVGGTLP